MRALNLLVFREARECARGPELKSALLRQLETLPDHSSLDDVINILLRAGELECAIADSGSAPVQPIATLTDHVAEALLARGPALGAKKLQEILARCPVPEEVRVSPPEGFAYYALHPLAFAEVLNRIPSQPPSVAVIGIRTIGATLSAVAAAAARARGIQAERITVRPGGHPYNRRTQFSPSQSEFIQQHAGAAAIFLVVDEGPGLSGSSFLSVAEALIESGVPIERILLLCGCEPDFNSLRTEHGARRACRFQWIAVSSEPYKPAEGEIFIGGGEWRQQLFREENLWPASWINLERLKYLSTADPAVSDRGQQRFFKFLGLGHYGDRVRGREERVAAAEFGVASRRECYGFASYCYLQSAARGMSPNDLSDDTLRRLANYCAFRAHAFPLASAKINALEHMAEHNLHELGLEIPVQLRLEHPVLADGRMQPHEWLLAKDGRMLKTDSGGHGDDHFFPGPTDIAWDLAGAIVEWRMNEAQAEAFLESYRRASGDDARARMADFVIAYTIFRSAYCMMAANALHGTAEQGRLEQAAHGYTALLARIRSGSRSIIRSFA